MTNVCGEVVSVEEKVSKNNKNFLILKIKPKTSGEQEVSGSIEQSVLVWPECTSFHNNVRINASYISTDLSNIMLPNLILQDILIREINKLKLQQGDDFKTYLQCYLVGKYIECEMDNSNEYNNMKRLIVIMRN